MSLEDLETINFPKMYSDDFYESWHSFKLIHSTVFVQFRKKEQGGVCFPYPEALIQLLHFQVEVLRYNHFVVG